jgi:hypothetical protein
VWLVILSITLLSHPNVTCSRDDKIVHIALNANHLLTHYMNWIISFIRVYTVSCFECPSTIYLWLYISIINMYCLSLTLQVFSYLILKIKYKIHCTSRKALKKQKKPIDDEIPSCYIICLVTVLLLV